MKPRGNCKMKFINFLYIYNSLEFHLMPINVNVIKNLFWVIINDFDEFVISMLYLKILQIWFY